MLEAVSVWDVLVLNVQWKMLITPTPTCGMCKHIECCMHNLPRLPLGALADPVRQYGWGPGVCVCTYAVASSAETNHAHTDFCFMRCTTHTHARARTRTHARTHTHIHTYTVHTYTCTTVYFASHVSCREYQRYCQWHSSR